MTYKILYFKSIPLARIYEDNKIVLIDCDAWSKKVKPSA